MNDNIIAYLLYADDLVLIPETPEGLQNTLTAFTNYVNSGICLLIWWKPMSVCFIEKLQNMLETPNVLQWTRSWLLP